MFSNFAWSEMLVIAAVAIIVVGPKDLPAMLRTFGKTIGSIKRMAGDFQRQFNDAIKDAELDELKDMTSTKGFAPLDDAKKTMEEFAQTMKDPVEPDSQVEVAPTKPEPKTVKKPASRKSPPKKPAATKTASKTGSKTTSKAGSTKPAGTRKPAAKRAAPKKTAASKAKAPVAKSAS